MRIEVTPFRSSFVKLVYGSRGMFVALALLVGLTPHALAQALPGEAYGPYSVTFLADGPGMSKPLTPPSSLDPRAAGLLERLDANG